jgi:hypothetical protein
VAVNDNTAEFQNAAKTCVQLLATIPGMVTGGTDQSTVEYYCKRDLAINSIIQLAEPTSQHAAGVIAVLAELIVSQEQDGCYSGLDGLVFEATLTKQERMMGRIDFAKECGDTYSASLPVDSDHGCLSTNREQ